MLRQMFGAQDRDQSFSCSDLLGPFIKFHTFMVVTDAAPVTVCLLEDILKVAGVCNIPREGLGENGYPSFRRQYEQYGWSPSRD